MLQDSTAQNSAHSNPLAIVLVLKLCLALLKSLHITPVAWFKQKAYKTIPCTASQSFLAYMGNYISPTNRKQSFIPYVTLFFLIVY